eukprot:137314_1
MLQATRTANRKGLKKKQAAQSQQQNDYQHQLQRKSVRYGGYNHNVNSRPHSPYTSHSSHFPNERNKRKSTIFRPTHAGQSAGAMVEHSVFSQINNPHSTQAKYEQYGQIKRRESISARKKREEKMIRKTVMMNAQQHQQLLNLVKNQNNTKLLNLVKNQNNTNNIINQQSSAPHNNNENNW